MSFQDARNLTGQMDNKGYQKGVETMVCQLHGWEGRKFNESGKPYDNAHLKDSNGEVQKVKIWLGNGPDFEQKDLNSLQTFTSVAVNPYKGKVYYKAFWDNMHPPTDMQQAFHGTPEQQGHLTPTASAPQWTPDQLPAGNPANAAPINRAMQGNPNAPQFQQPKQQNGAPNWDKIAEGKVRCNLICAILSNSAIDSTNSFTVQGMAEEYMDYIFGRNINQGQVPI